MLWSTIYEFYVKYIFGGFLGLNNTSQNAIFAPLLNSNGDFVTNIYTYEARMSASFLGFDDYFISWGNYFSLIATIITLVVILVLCCALIKKIYNMCAHIIG